MACPGCGVAGRKDEACTHMTCVKCETKWCYVCGLSEANADKSFRGGGRKSTLFEHNTHFEFNQNRCPMYLTQIGTIDDEWPAHEEEEDNSSTPREDAEEECLEIFHRHRTLGMLYGAKKELGDEEWAIARQQFPNVRNCGFTDEQIDEFPDTMLFKRISREMYYETKKNGELPESGDEGGG